jgi:hypothetical protein
MLQHQQFTYTVTGHHQYFSSQPEEWFEVDTNEDETDPDWNPSTEKCVDNASPAMSLDFRENKKIIIKICIIFSLLIVFFYYYTPASRRGRGYTVLPLSVLPSVQDIFRHIFLSNC